MMNENEGIEIKIDGKFVLGIKKENYQALIDGTIKINWDVIIKHSLQNEYIKKILKD
jgi:hypothetical protein